MTHPWNNAQHVAKYALDLRRWATDKQYAEAHEVRDKFRGYCKEMRKSMKSSNNDPTQWSKGTMVGPFDSVNIRYFSFDSIRLVIFTKLDLSISQN